MILPFLREASKNLFSKPSTEAFPAAPAPAKPNYRGRISYDPEKCVNCGVCKSRCPYGLDIPNLLKRNLVDWNEHWAEREKYWNQ